jgi:hypothetical protein
MIQQVAVVVSQVTLALDTRFLTRLSPSLRDHFLKLLASVRLLVTGQPLR